MNLQVFIVINKKNERCIVPTVGGYVPNEPAFILTLFFYAGRGRRGNKLKLYNKNKNLLSRCQI
jgi:hypothetical protein